MPLSGLNTLSARPRGGVAKVELIPAPEYAGRVPSPAAAWAFREDRARYSEETTGEMPALSPLVRHTLEMELPATDTGRSRVRELAAVCSARGVVAVVTMASGEVVVAGYSPRFGTRYPLRLTAVKAGSGRSPADFPTIALTLESVDADPAMSRP